jgi:hypothetical protein
MPTPTYTPLATITLASTDSEIVFTSIPATYRDLVLVVGGKATSAGAFNVILNNDTGNGSRVFALGNGSTTSSSTAATLAVLEMGSDETTGIVHIMDYSATDKHKTLLARGGSAGGVTIMMAGRWASTSAVNSIKLNRGSSSFAVGTTLSLYAIAS